MLASRLASQASLMMSPAVTLVADAQHVALQTLADGSAMLGNFATQETVILPAPAPGADAWRIGADENGFAVAFSGEQRLPASRAFRMVLCEGPSEGRFASVDGGKPMLLADLFSERTLCSVGFRVGTTQQLVSLQILRHRFANQGCMLWRSLPEVYTAAALQVDNRGAKWVYHSFAAWQRYLSSLGMDAGVYLKRVYTKESVRDSAEGALLQDRVQEFPCASTAALFALMVRWMSVSTQAGGLKRETDRDKVFVMFEALLFRLRSARVEIRIADDVDVAWEPPLQPEGEVEFALELSRGEFDIESMRTSGRPMFMSLLRAGMGSSAKMVWVGDALQMLAGCGARACHFFKQLIWQTGVVLGAAVAA